MHVKAIKTARVESHTPGDDPLSHENTGTMEEGSPFPSDRIQSFLDDSLPAITEGDIVVITSKVIAILEGREVPTGSISKKDLVYKEADLVLESENTKHDIYLTIKDGMLMPTAGIDESNSSGNYLLLPKNSQDSACQIWHHLRTKHNIHNLGIIITDSRTTMMRAGVTGVALGWCGFMPIYSYVGKPDLYGKPLRVTKVNILDALATSAVFVMGEGDECTPIAIIQNAPKIAFLDRKPSKEESESIKISMEEDLYGPLLKAGHWVSKKI